MARLLKNIVIITTALSLSCCHNLIYQEKITQGYQPSPEIEGKLKVGMKQEEVRALLGEPTLINPVYKNKWAYVYSLSHGYNTDDLQTIALVFKNGKLDKITKNTN